MSTATKIGRKTLLTHQAIRIWHAKTLGEPKKPKRLVSLPSSSS